MTNQAEVEALIDAMDRGRQQWISGSLDLTRQGTVRQAEEMTIFGPLGGPGPRPGDLTLDELEAIQVRVAANFRGGSGSCDVIRAIVEGDLVVLVMIERSEVLFEGKDEPHPWILRTTQVFRKAGATWIRLHRHADPLIHPRDLDAALALLETP